jgi:hypothetical protein
MARGVGTPDIGTAVVDGESDPHPVSNRHRRIRVGAGERGEGIVAVIGIGVPEAGSAQPVTLALQQDSGVDLGTGRRLTDRPLESPSRADTMRRLLLGLLSPLLLPVPLATATLGLRRLNASDGHHRAERCCSTEEADKRAPWRPRPGLA